MSVRLCCFDNLWRLHARARTHTHTESTINQIDQQIDRVRADIYSPAALSAGIYVCVCVSSATMMQRVDTAWRVSREKQRKCPHET